MDSLLPDRDHLMKEVEGHKNDDEVEVDKVNGGRPSNKKLEFQDLPLDIMHLMVERILRPEDLKRVCRVNKQLHQIAVRYLYREVQLEIAGADERHIASFASPGNIGLGYLRNLHIHNTSGYSSLSLVEHEVPEDLAARMILSSLPENTLEAFHSHSRPLTADNMLLLFRRQHKLKHLVIERLDRDIIPDLRQDLCDNSQLFRATKGLHICIEYSAKADSDSIRLSAFFVHLLQSQLEHLFVEGNASYLMLPHQLVATIFQCKTPFDQCTPFTNLRSLKLSHITVQSCLETWCLFIDFPQLQKLELDECQGTALLLAQMCMTKHLPRCLESLNIKLCDDPDNSIVATLDEFLLLISGLKRLALDLRRIKSLPNVQGVLKHGETLELLSVHCAKASEPDDDTDEDEDDTSTYEHFYPPKDFSKICQGCPKLEQLSCAWPPTDLMDADSTRGWIAYENALRDLRGLVTLKILNWPEGGFTSHESSRSMYVGMLQVRAGMIFDAITSPSRNRQPGRLRLIAFGNCDSFYDRDDFDYAQFLFLRSNFIDATGQDCVHATEVGWCQRKYLETNSDVLDLVMFNRGSKNLPPCREP